MCNYVADAKEVDSLQMDFETIREATDHFSETNKLGQGGFGTVYLVRYIIYKKKIMMFQSSSFDFKYCP